jgi:peptide/nickel transport system ATP-binding protein
METTLNVNALKIYYKTLRGYAKAVDDVSFEIRRGEILGIAGESGCGKSTLGNSFVILKPPMYYISGDALLDGKNLFTMTPKDMNKVRFEKISIIPQFAMDALSPTKKIGVFIQDIIGEHGLRYDAAFRKKVAERLALVNLREDVLKKFSIELSGGMKQRAVFVISTLLDPQILIADEVTSALDVTSQRYVADMIVKFRNAGIVGSVVFMTHDLAILYEISDRILVMYAGHAVEAASNDIIIHEPKHPYTKALVASLPRAGVRFQEQKLSGIPGYPPTLLNIPECCRFHARCPYKTDICVNETPKTEACGDDHTVACWHWKTISKG